MLAELLLCGLVLAGTSFAEQERIDLSEIQGPKFLPNANPDWKGPTESEPRIIDSSEHGVKPGKKPTSCRCGMANKSNRRIVGGKIHGPNEYPWIVGIAMGSTPNRPHCGGSIISPWHVLTAAHCTEEARSLVVTAGDYDRAGYRVSVVHRVRAIYDHERYNRQILRNDISLLLLSTPIKETDKIQLVCLPTGTESLVGRRARYIGWGAERLRGPMTNKPKMADIPIIDTTSCGRAWPPGLITQSHLCTHSYRATPCQGDSGGPVVVHNSETNMYVLVGLVSFGKDCETTIPSVNTRISAYLPWIRKIIQATTPGQQTCS